MAGARSSEGTGRGRRRAGRLVAGVLMVTAGILADPADMAGQTLRIGVIGSGNMGGTLGEAWARAGHQVFFSSRNPGELQELVARAGPNARAGLPR